MTALPPGSALVRRLLAVLLLGGMLPSRCPAAGAIPTLEDLTPAAVRKIDRLAAVHPLEGMKEETVNLSGSLVAWAISRLTLTPGEEKNAADRLLKIIRTAQKTRPVPDHVAAVWESLTAELPAHLRPEPYRYTLTLLEQDLPYLDALGGGHVCLTTGLLERLGNTPRARGALAFLLAREIGHNAYLHCRRGWQLLALQEEASDELARLPEAARLEHLLETGVRVSGALVRFLYSREQHYEADLFAWKLCQCAGYPEEDALDGLRYLAVLEDADLLDGKARPDVRERSLLEYYLSTHPDTLARLRRLQMERAGKVASAGTFGLFLFDRATGELRRCPGKGVGRGARAVVVVHGLRGDEGSFEDLLSHLARQRGLAGHLLLVFRYPNNESLARCGLFLRNEVRRCVADPHLLTFVCHSAGGLAFRHYAEVCAGPFARAVFLGTPHRGSSLTSLRLLLEIVHFARGLNLGWVGALASYLPEGRGAVAHDLHPDSLFLRYLGRHRCPRERYHIVYGEYLNPLGRVAIAASFQSGRRLLLEQIERLPVRQRGGDLRRMVERLHLPAEVLRGDFIVSGESARMEGAAENVRTRLHHLSLKTDPRVMKVIVRTATRKE